MVENNHKVTKKEKATAEAKRNIRSGSQKTISSFFGGGKKRTAEGIRAEFSATKKRKTTAVPTMPAVLNKTSSGKGKRVRYSQQEKRWCVEQVNDANGSNTIALREIKLRAEFDNVNKSMLNKWKKAAQCYNITFV